MKVTPVLLNASKLVRFDTGKSNEAEFARCVQAYMCGLGRAFSAAAVAKTTGVSKTTVASRLNIAVTAAAAMTTATSSRDGRRRPG